MSTQVISISTKYT